MGPVYQIGVRILAQVTTALWASALYNIEVILLVGESELFEWSSLSWIPMKIHVRTCTPIKTVTRKIFKHKAFHQEQHTLKVGAWAGPGVQLHWG